MTRASYDQQLVAFALVLALLAWFVAMNVIERVSNTRGWVSRSWLLAGALAVGTSLWGMQLLAMLAFDLPTPVVFHVPTLAFTLGLAVVVCFFALWIAGGPHLGLLRLGVAGLCMGLGVATIHYLGIFAMQIVPAVRYDASLFGASVAAAFVACWLTLALAFWLRHGRTAGRFVARAVAALVPVASISAVFHLGFMAASFDENSYSLGAATALDFDAAHRPLLVVVGASGAALALLIVPLVAGYARELIERAEHAGRLELTNTPVQHVADTDPLTGVANRALLAKHFDVMRAAARDGSASFALLVVDIDRFRHLNATLGHAVGDAVLRELAQRLSTLVRPGDAVARPDGDEFALLLAGVASDEQAASVAARVREELGRTIRVDDLEVQVAVRIGAGLYPRDGEDVDTLLKHAHGVLQGPVA
jgi:diguanylate cyclase (GGDEF)-like protein